MTKLRWIAVPRRLKVGVPLEPVLGTQPDGHERVLFVSVVDVLAALDLYDDAEDAVAGVRSSLEIVLAREGEFA